MRGGRNLREIQLGYPLYVTENLAQIDPHSLDLIFAQLQGGKSCNPLDLVGTDHGGGV